jgi:hypothetical protein
MMMAAESSRRDEALGVLRQATFHKDVPSETVTQMFDILEKEESANPKASAMKGQWELVYSSLIPSGYFPVKEVADFYGYTLTSSWGPIPLGGFEGDSEVISETKPAVIKFNSKKYKLGPITFNQAPKDRSYTFLYTGTDFAAALSSSGGKTLLKRYA